MKFIGLAWLAMVLMACSGSNSWTTPSGVQVNYLVKGTGESPVRDSILLLYLRIEARNHVLHQSTIKPLPMQFQPEADGGHLQEVISGLKVGDSVRFSVSAANLYLQTYQIPVPDFLNPEDTLTISLRFLNQLSQEKFENDQRQAQLARTQKEVEAIDNYLLEKNITPVKTESGLRYVVFRAGLDSRPMPGDVVTIHYVLRTLTGDTIDDSYQRKQPLGFTWGRAQVIAGWDEGIGYLGEGAQATLYLPSTLAFGDQKRPNIPANSILISDVEVISIEKQ